MLDLRERVSSEEIGDDGTVWLQYPLAMILFRPFHYEFEQFPGFEPGVISIFPLSYFETGFSVVTGFFLYFLLIFTGRRNLFRNFRKCTRPRVI